MAKKKDSVKKYIYARGRRKTSVATLRLFKGKGEDLINGKKVKQVYITSYDLKHLYLPFEVTETQGKYYFVAKSKGGGRSGQRDAIKLALARTLLQVDQNFRKPLKGVKLLTRDPRAKERKKPGLKKARKKEQYSKR